MVLVSRDYFIVIADDDSDDQFFIREALERRQANGGFACLDNGEKLMEYLKHEYPLPPQALILLDLNMPLKDGYQALAEIKQDPALKSVPTIVLTSSTRDADKDKCYELGCDAFFQKPLSVHEYDTVAGNILAFLQPK